MSSICPGMQQALDILAALDLKPIQDLGPVAARRQDADSFDPLWNRGLPEIARVCEARVQGDQLALTARFYRPISDAVLPAIFYLHGGGFMSGSLESHDSICRRLALASNCIVVALDYPLAPEHRFPTALLEIGAAIPAILTMAEKFGVSPDRFALAGDSAGANLALSVSRRLCDRGETRLRCAVLVYGMFDAEMTSPAYDTYGDGTYLLSSQELAYYWQNYFASEADRHDPRANLVELSLDGLPPIYVAAAELDPLLDDSLRLFERLRNHDSAHCLRLWPGLLHAVFQMGDSVPELMPHIEHMAGFLRHHLDVARSC